MTLYETLADTISQQIEQGLMREGEKIPSVRRTSQLHQLSISTVIRAFLLLESRGIIESRPQSGYFVRQRSKEVPPRQDGDRQDASPLNVSGEPPVTAAMPPYALALSNLRSINCKNSLPLGSPYPDPSLFPWARISQLARGLYRRRERQELMGALPPGNQELIRQIARRHLETGLAISASEIIITEGATEAINLCLQAIAKPGDAIAVESPTYYAVLHAIERRGMLAVPIATDPEAGIDVNALESAITASTERRIVGCIVMPNFQNPLGFNMPERRKKALVEMMTRHGLPIIENDVYGELHFGEQRPKSLKAFDTQGLVLYCGSFSKSLTAEYRIGWALTGRYRQEIEHLKFLNTVTTPSLPQIAIAEYLKNEGYDFHLRRLRKTYAQQVRIMTAAVKRFFPAGTTTSRPAGGYLLWIVLPAHVNALELYSLAQARDISIAPGPMFSLDGGFTNCLRLNYSFTWDQAMETAVRTLGEIAKELSEKEPVIESAEAHRARFIEAKKAADAATRNATLPAPHVQPPQAIGLTKAS
ncbi:PLP-dependent aminotransferase family protein [Herbaspirillum rhizosphaerae]|uniref:aminotransferase-like domain-containing protein n=1 Tax=Herbaspirillum rhizosphaerae TaxID=346179 RepID=UPI0009FA22F6|nr:PLP-dependent aminotransferase family protein [Herbaspirillum rhizosphaerae]